MAKRPTTTGEEDSEYDYILQAFAETLKRARVASGLTAEELAARADLQRSYIFALERGNTNVTLKTVAKLAKAVGLQPRDFLPFEEVVELSPHVLGQLQGIIAAQHKAALQRTEQDTRLAAQLGEADRLLAGVAAASKAGVSAEAGEPVRQREVS